MTESAKILFFDTPVFAARMFGGIDDIACVEALVRERRVETSHYVREQYKATFLRASVYLHNLLLESKSLDDAAEGLDLYPFNTKQGIKCRKVLNSLMRMPDASVEHVVGTLRRWIRREILAVFDRGITVLDATSCRLAAVSPEFDDLGVCHFPVKCTLEHRPDCSIEGFWEARRSALSAVANVSLGRKGALPEHVAVAKKAAEQVLVGEPPRGRRCWYALSDAAIVAESPVGCELATTNVKDFDALVSAMHGHRTVVNPLPGRRRSQAVRNADTPTPTQEEVLRGTTANASRPRKSPRAPTPSSKESSRK